jgi:hypothetical protein
MRMTEIADVRLSTWNIADRQPEVWAREHLHLGPSVDMHLAASMESVPHIIKSARLMSRLCKLKDHWKSIFETGTPSLGYVNSAIDTMISQCEALMARFFTKDCQFPSQNPRQAEVY